MRTDSSIANVPDKDRSPDQTPIPLICIVGPTAVGKSKTGVELAKRIGGEILSADSMQIYRGMDIGTAKITYDEMQSIPHYGIDIVNPSDSFSVADYQVIAEQSVTLMQKKGAIPIIVGGTGLYIQSLTHRMTYTEVGEDETFRSQMFQIAEEPGGSMRLHQELTQVDPTTAARLHPNDIRRVIRALEVYSVTGKPMSEQYGMQGRNPRYHTVMFGLNRDRAELYRLIDLRVDLMLEQGLLEEVKHLLEVGVNPTCTSMQGIGYKEMVMYLHGECSYQEAVDLIKQGSRRYAKRQLSWFRRFPEIMWYNVGEQDMEYILNQMVEILKKEFDTYSTNSTKTI